MGGVKKKKKTRRNNTRGRDAATVAHSDDGHVWELEPARWRASRAPSPVEVGAVGPVPSIVGPTKADKPTPMPKSTILLALEA
jgi:hypothetical protein